MKNHKRGKDEENDKIKPCEDSLEDERQTNPQEESNTPEAKPPDEKQAYNELLDRYQRSLAEFDNFRKRTNKEKAVMYDDGMRDTVEKLLPVIDNFERALNASEDKENKFYQGVAMIARQLSACLTELGVELIAAAPGEPFNPNVHFAVAHVEDAEYDVNVVVAELQKGYKHKDKVIRPSMVRVAN